MEQDELWNRNVCSSGHFHILRKKTNRSPCRIGQMWAQIAVVFLLCLATLCCCLWHPGLPLLKEQGRAGVGASSEVFSLWCSLSTTKGRAEVRRAPLSSDRRKMQPYSGVHFEADVRKRATAEPSAVRNDIFWQLRCLGVAFNLNSFQWPLWDLSSLLKCRWVWLLIWDSLKHLCTTLMLRFIASLTPYVPQCQTQHLLAWISCQILGSSLSLWFLWNVTTAYLLLTLFST